MKTPPLKLFFGLGASAILLGPVALVVACGEAASAAPQLAEEEAAQKAIVEAPSATNDSSPFATRILTNLKMFATKLAGTTPLAEYLAANKPQVTTTTLEDFMTVLTEELKHAYGLPVVTQFRPAEFNALLRALGASTDLFTTAFLKTIKDYDGAKSDATTSWAAQIKFWTYVFDPAKNYAHLKALLQTEGVVTESMVTNLETVMTAPQMQPSGVTDTSIPAKRIVGWGGKDRIFATTKPSFEPIKASDYFARAESEIRKAFNYGYESDRAIYVDLGKLNSAMELNLALGYALKIKTAATRAIASFWKLDQWADFANFLAAAEYTTNNMNMVHGSNFNTVRPSNFDAVREANEALITALRSETQTPQVTFVASTDYTPAASSAYAEDTLTDAGLLKAKPYTDILATKPFWQAMLKANADYTNRVLGMLAGLSATQFAEFGKFLDGLYTAYEALFEATTFVLNTSLEAKFNRSYAINLWNTESFALTPDNATLEDYGYSNFFFQVFTRHFNGPKYIAPEA